MRGRPPRGLWHGVRHREAASQAGTWADVQAVNAEVHTHVGSSGSESLSTVSTKL